MAYIEPQSLKAIRDNGSLTDLSATAQGHLEVEVHGPRLPFGSVHSESIHPVFQTDAVYGLNSGQINTSAAGSGTATATNSLFTAATGATIYSLATIQSRKRLRYRAGQGVIGRFAGWFSAGADNSYQVMGFGHSEDGAYFCRKNGTFGILYSNRGVRETRTLTITVASSTAQNVTVTLNGVAYSVAVTNSGNIQRTVWEISQGDFGVWNAQPSGATVIFINGSAGAASGTYSLTASTATGTFAQTKAGVAATELFVPQSSWNMDVCDGSKSEFNSSGYNLDATKGNVYQINIQYLGFGTISFFVESVSDGVNNANFINVHTLKLPNTLTATSFGNPSFPFTMAAYSAGSTTNLTVNCGSFAGFIEGEKKLHGNRMSYFNSSTSVGPSNYQCLFTVMNSLYNSMGSRSNQAVVNLLSISAALKHTSPCIIYLIKNGTLAGNPNFSAFSSTSCTLWDTSATTVTFSDNAQLLWTGHMGDTGEIDHHFNGAGAEELTLQPGEYFTIAAKAVTGNPTYVTASLNTREDQ